MSNNTDWKQAFFGREELMHDLQNIWSNIDNSGPQFIVLKGEPGAGKTRILQELFHEMSKASDPEDYWPERLQTDSENLKLHTSSSKGKCAIPWLWFPMRFQDSQARNNGEVDGALREAFQLSEPHIKKAINQAGYIDHIFSSGKGVASGVGAEALGLVIGAVPIISVIKDRVEFNKVGSGSTTKIINESKLDMSAQLIRGLTKLLDKKEPVPVIVVLDDLSFLSDNGSSNAFLHKLFEEVKEKGEGWPLIVISTVHPLQWKTHDNGVEHAGQKLYTNLQNQFSYHEYNLQDAIYQLTPADMKKVISASELNITDEQSNSFIELADGNPLVLREMLIDGLSSTGSSSELKEMDFNEIIESSNSLIDIIDKRIKKLSAEERSMLYASAFQGERFLIAMVLQVFSKVTSKGSTSLAELTTQFDELHKDTFIIDKPHNQASEFTQRSHWEAVNKRMKGREGDYIKQFETFLEDCDVEKFKNLPSEMLEKIFNISVRLKIESIFPRELLALFIISLVEQRRFIDALPIVAHALRMIEEYGDDWTGERKVDSETNLEELIAIVTVCAAMGFETYSPKLSIPSKIEGFDDILLVDQLDMVIRKLDFESLSDVDKIRIYTAILDFYTSIACVNEERQYSTYLAKIWRDYIDSKADECSINELSDGFRCNVQYAGEFFRFNSKMQNQGQLTEERVDEAFFDVFRWMQAGPVPLLREKGGQYKELADIYAELSTAMMMSYGDELWKLYGDEEYESQRKLRPGMVIKLCKYLREFLCNCDEKGFPEHILWPVTYASTLLVELTLLWEKDMQPMSENLVGLVLKNISVNLNTKLVSPMHEMVALVDMCNIFQVWTRQKLQASKEIEIPPKYAGKFNVVVQNIDKEEIDELSSKLLEIRRNLSGRSKYFGGCYPYMSMQALSIVIDVEEEFYSDSECDVNVVRKAIEGIIKMIKISREQDRLNCGELCKIFEHAFNIIKSVPIKQQDELLAIMYDECSDCDIEKLHEFKEQVFSAN